VLSKGFGTDGRRRQYKVSGRTKQDVVEALKKRARNWTPGLARPGPTRSRRPPMTGLSTDCRAGPSAPRRSTRMRWPRSWPRSAGGHRATITKRSRLRDQRDRTNHRTGTEIKVGKGSCGSLGDELECHSRLGWLSSAFDAQAITRGSCVHLSDTPHSAQEHSDASRPPGQFSSRL
jgi:hypothetical protein